MNASVQILLKSVLVLENGTAEAAVKGVNVLTATLIKPNTTNPNSVTSIRSLSLQDRVETDFTQEAFSARQLFKEQILGDCVMSVELTAVEKATKLEKFLAKAFPKVVGIVVSIIPGLGMVLSSVIGAATDSIFTGHDPHDRITVIGRAEVSLDAVNAAGELAANLTVPEDVVLNSAPFFDEDGNELIRRITLKKGLVNAKVMFHIDDITPSAPALSPGVLTGNAA